MSVLGCAIKVGFINSRCLFLASRKNNTVQLDFGFASRVRVFYATAVRCFRVPVPSHWETVYTFSKKSFMKKSYISYTARRDILYTKAFSGVELGEGLRFGV